MFGIDRLHLTRRFSDEDLLERLLDRSTPIAALTSLRKAIRTSQDHVSLSATAVCLDSSVFLRLANHPRSDDIVDYFRSRHGSALILPGQAVQEFWNNQLSVVSTMANKVRKKFDELRREVRDIEPIFGEFSLKFNEVMDQFIFEHGNIYDERTVRKTGALLDLLEDRAIKEFVCRSRFSGIARNRHQTKTPPGFKDDGDGDFFVWSDLLLSLLKARRLGLAFSRVALVTEDKKPDWSRDGEPHPILSAELIALTGVGFQVWSLERLANEVAELLDA